MDYHSDEINLNTMTMKEAHNIRLSKKKIIAQTVQVL